MVPMSKAGVMSLRRILRFAAIVEVGTGLALLIDPRLVVGLLIGARAPPDEIPLGRLPGIAILALGIACWPTGRIESGPGVFRGMLTYNVLMSLFLVYLF